MERYETPLTCVLLGLCILLAGINLTPRLTLRPVVLEQSQPKIHVSITGQVQEPGTYTLPWGARVDDLIQAAGGLTPYASESLVNLAAPLDTGGTVFVPTTQSSTGEARLSLNSASQSELDTLPGIGPATAQKIIAARPYASVDDLVKVSGIGTKTLERLRPLVGL